MRVAPWLCCTFGRTPLWLRRLHSFPCGLPYAQPPPTPPSALWFRRYCWVVASRFVAGLPHGAYFAIASLVAGSLLGPGKRAKGIAFVLGGLTIANVIGVPLGIKVSRRETSANLGIAVLLALGYYMLTVAVSWLDRHPEYHPDLLFWLPNAVFLGLGVWLFLRIERR